MEEYFNYLMVKITTNEYITGLIPSLIVKECIFSGFKNLNEIKVNVNKIKEDLMSTTQTLSSDIGAKCLTITKYDKDFENSNCKSIWEIAYQILAKFTADYYKKKYYSINDWKVLTSKIKDLLKYYMLSK